MTLRETFQAELDRFGVQWCAGPCRYRNSHRRGFATQGTVHLDAKIGTRRSLYRGLHEIGHIVLGHDRRGRKRRWQVEAEAEAWAQERMAELGLEPPPEIVDAGRAYVARMKRWGDNISRALD
ncbi:MAG: hypothetical protein ABI828_00120 [Actinomycetota bacterium]